MMHSNDALRNYNIKQTLVWVGGNFCCTAIQASVNLALFKKDYLLLLSYLLHSLKVTALSAYHIFFVFQEIT